jgi:hypothetical protein
VLLQQDDFQGAPASIALFARRVHGIDSHLKAGDFLEGRAKGKTIIGCYSIEEMVATLAKPARVRLMVKAGEVVDQFIAQVLPHLTTGDIIIDGGNRCRRAAAGAFFASSPPASTHAHSLTPRRPPPRMRTHSLLNLVQPPSHCLKVLFSPPRRPPPRMRTHSLLAARSHARALTHSCRRLTLAAQSCNLVDALFEEELDGKRTACALVPACGAGCCSCVH